MTTAVHHDLKSLPPNGYVDGIYSIVNPQVGTTRAGKPYLKCLLRDATGETAARQWSCEERAFPEIERAGFVRVAGHTDTFPISSDRYPTNWELSAVRATTSNIRVGISPLSGGVSFTSHGVRTHTRFFNTARTVLSATRSAESTRVVNGGRAPSNSPVPT